MIPTLYLAAEDEPGLAVGRRLVAEVPPLSVYREENARGFGRLKKKAGNYQQMAENGLPVLMLTDLDQKACPSGMIAEWIGERPNAGFLFRICVREVEAWILADREAFARFLGIKAALLPMFPEQITDPKAELIRLSKKSPRRELRTGFAPNGSATIGPRHNEFLCGFVRDFWNPEAASVGAPSLGRARKRLSELAAFISSVPPI
jgi:hypothetical protein